MRFSSLSSLYFEMYLLPAFAMWAALPLPNLRQSLSIQVSQTTTRAPFPWRVSKWTRFRKSPVIIVTWKWRLSDTLSVLYGCDLTPVAHPFWQPILRITFMMGSVPWNRHKHAIPTFISGFARAPSRTVRTPLDVYRLSIHPVYRKSPIRFSIQCLDYHDVSHVFPWMYFQVNCAPLPCIWISQPLTTTSTL